MPRLTWVFTGHTGHFVGRKLRTQGFFKRTAKTLIKLGRCPGWPESSLGTQVILLVLSCCSSITEVLRTCNIESSFCFYQTISTIKYQISIISIYFKKHLQKMSLHVLTRQKPQWIFFSTICSENESSMFMVHGVVEHTHSMFNQLFMGLYSKVKIIQHSVI